VSPLWPQNSRHEHRFTIAARLQRSLAQRGLPFGLRPAPPEKPELVYEDFKRDILPYPMGNIHPRFWAWYMGSGTFMGAMGDFLAAIINPNVDCH